MKKKKNKKFKFLTNFIVIFIVLIIVLYFSLKDNYDEIISAIFNMNKLYILVAILILGLYRFLVSCSHYMVIKTNDEAISLFKLFKISFIILFFHGVTPFAGGGQPMEVYFLHKENITVTKATNITLQNFIVYQIALVSVGMFALIYNSIYGLFPNDNLIKKLVVLGFMVNFLVLLVSFILSFGKKVNRVICIKGIHLLSKFKIIKDKEKVENDFNKYLDNFHKNAVKLKKNKMVVLKCILVNILAILVLYSMPYFLALGFDLDFTILEGIVATSYVMIMGAFVPIPGGTGGIEYGFVFFYNYLIKGSVLNGLMLVWRFVSYYFGMIIGAVYLTNYRKKVRE